MNFLPLFSLSLAHVYYPDGRCADFSIEPTLATQQLLNNYRYILKSAPDRVRILAPVDDQGVQFVPLPQSAVFVFELRLHNPDFALFTDLTEIMATTAPCYTNATLLVEPGQLVFRARRAWATEHFVVQQPAQEESFILRGRPLAMLQPPDFTVAGLGAVTNVTRYMAEAKVIIVNSAAATQADRFQVTYETPVKLAPGILAEVEIHVNDSWPAIANGPRAYQVSFKAKQARWHYYLITDKNNGQWRIEDKFSDPLVFSLDNPPAADAVAQALAAQYPDKRLLRFSSAALIACQQQARKQLYLFLDGTQIGEPLPNPSLQNYSTSNVSREGSRQTEAALFQIVRYFTHSFRSSDEIVPT